MFISIANNGDSDRTISALKSDIVNVLGKETSIKEITNIALIVIPGICIDDEENDITEALMREEADREKIGIKKLSCFGASKNSLVIVPQRVAEGVLKRGKIRVGLVIFRVRVAAKRIDR